MLSASLMLSDASLKTPHVKILLGGEVFEQQLLEIPAGLGDILH